MLEFNANRGTDSDEPPDSPTPCSLRVTPVECEKIYDEFQNEYQNEETRPVPVWKDFTAGHDLV